MVLLVAAALFVRTFANLAARPIGFDRNGVLLVNVDMRRAPEPAEQRRQIGDRIVEAVRTLPGVKSVSASALSPVGNMNWNGAFQVVGAPPQTGRQRLAYRNSIAPGWFATYGTALVGGRDFVPADRGGSPPVAIVNQAFARQFLNGQSPIRAHAANRKHQRIAARSRRSSRGRGLSIASCRPATDRVYAVGAGCR
jgi:hypothetical protein